MNFEIAVRRSLLGVVTLIVYLGVSANAQQLAPEIVSPKDESTSTKNTPTPDAWQVGLTPYIWFAGVHGTAGALAHQTDVHATFGKLFQYLNIGLMGEVEARKKRVLLTTDFMWMRLSDEKAFPVNEVGVQSIDAKAACSRSAHD